MPHCRRYGFQRRRVRQQTCGEGVTQIVRPDAAGNPGSAESIVPSRGNTADFPAMMMDDIWASCLGILFRPCPERFQSVLRDRNGPVRSPCAFFGVRHVDDALLQINTRPFQPKKLAGPYARAQRHAEQNHSLDMRRGGTIDQTGLMRRRRRDALRLHFLEPKPRKRITWDMSGADAPIVCGPQDRSPAVNCGCADASGLLHGYPAVDVIQSHAKRPPLTENV